MYLYFNLEIEKTYLLNAFFGKKHLKCKNGELTPIGYLLPENSLEENGIWRCDRCENNVGGFTVAAVMKGLEDELETLTEQDPQKIELLDKNW
jgi:hypothetical protein